MEKHNERIFRIFFGAGEPGEYKDFTFAHLAPILVAAGIIYLIYRYRNELRNNKHDIKIR